ncbi:hypothetical protein PFICI_02873 [Pestalotiopsis fici W106-1]|uniref:Uncharacterized protein n=1 Tax=Pestalotiopsis fici (strain W106-1 / CGMCC3.15140) TaxID=1229662 RepID=W3XFH3_PESFW|nr:uncharacterized protein PFICI_02873 [Pestalotiopsis fici W106-1]ETS84848.1 hypothetical protein PFICI_02873 [Pestalotiopsis fici W106-1]
MAEKRPADGDSDQPVKKHRFNSSSNSAKRHGQGVDETYGQRFAFGNLDAATIPKDEDLEWEDETDALAYLKSVRSQAEGIPHVLIARKAGPELPVSKDGAVDRSIYEDGRGDFRGFYHDGAYTAYPDGYNGEQNDNDEEEGEEGEEGEATDKEDGESSEVKSEESSLGGPRNSNSAEIHDAYFISITRRYKMLRDILQSEPPGTAVKTLSASHPTQVRGFGTTPSPYKEWAPRLRNTDPLPVQIASMHKDSVLRLIRIILNGNFFRRGQELRERTSRWIWALLARLPERGELDYTEVGWVRELGKRAVMFMLSLAEADVLREQYGVEGGADNEDNGDVEEIDVVSNEDIGLDGNEKVEAVSTAPEDPTDSKNEEITSESPLQTSDAISTAPPSQDKLDASVDIPTPQSDVEMQIDSDEEDGEVSAEPQELQKPTADVEAAKARLLAQLESSFEEQVQDHQTGSIADTPVATSGEAKSGSDGKNEMREANLRATLNMILTVAGEFYGQRDLLEFRDPFGRMIGV